VASGVDVEQFDRETVVTTIRPGLDITNTCFRVGARHFELDGLRDLETRHTAHHSLTRNAGVLAGLTLLALIFLSPFMHPAGIIATALVLVGLVGVTVAAAARRPRRMELWAQYRGHTTQLFASDDSWLFGAVERQIHREVLKRRRTAPASAKLPQRVLADNRIRETYALLEGVEGAVDPATDVVDRALTSLGPPPHWRPGGTPEPPKLPSLSPQAVDR
jgi:hypothetical protein